MHDLENKLITEKVCVVDRCLLPADHGCLQQSIVAESGELTVHLTRGLLHADQLLAEERSAPCVFARAPAA